jgi:hypothetical protein
MICIYFVYTNDIHKLNMEMLHADQGRGTSRDNNYDTAESLFDPDSMWFVCPQLFFHCRCYGGLLQQLQQGHSA